MSGIDELATTLGLHAVVPASLADLEAYAPLTRRVDRKYLVAVDVARDLVRELSATHRVLQVDGRRSTSYRSTYFDTVDLAACRAHVQGRRRRWKVRTRLYVEDAVCHTEVKSHNGRGDTVKDVNPSLTGRYGQLAGADQAFVAQVLTRLTVDVDVADLSPAAEIGYERASLVDLVAGTKVTVDWHVSSTRGQQRALINDRYVLVETKGGTRQSPADRMLLARGVRPRPFSKYVSGVSVLTADIADNDVRALRRDRLHVAS